MLYKRHVFFIRCKFIDPFFVGYSDDSCYNKVIFFSLGIENSHFANVCCSCLLTKELYAHKYLTRYGLISSICPIQSMNRVFKSVDIL